MNKLERIQWFGLFMLVISIPYSLFIEEWLGGVLFGIGITYLLFSGKDHKKLESEPEK